MLSSEYIKRAEEMGRNAHAGKTWAAGLPYSEHLERVAVTVRTFLEGRVPEDVLRNLQAAAWLHDAVEDTGMTLDTVEQELGPNVRALVWAVTDEPGANRTERHARTFPKTKNVPYATALKLADRIVNVEANVSNRGGIYNMYRKEHDVFFKALYNPTHDELEPMWRHLNRLMQIEPSKAALKLADKIMANIQSSLSVNAKFVDTRDTIAAVIEENTPKPDPENPHAGSFGK